MNLKNLKLVSSNDLTRQLTFKDVSGGYTNDVNIVLIKIDKPFKVKEDGKTRYQNTLDPLHPEYLVSPTAVEIGTGVEFTLDSYKLGLTKSTEEYLTFKDGVLNVDYYVGFDSLTVTGTKGNDYIEGVNMGDLLTNYDSVIVGTTVYELDKSRPTASGTRVYLLSKLEDKVTSVIPSEHSNLKLRNNFRTKCVLSKSAHILGQDYSIRSRVMEKERGVLKVIRNDIASRIFFEQQDYYKANSLLLENVEIGNFLGILKGGDLKWD